MVPWYGSAPASLMDVVHPRVLAQPIGGGVEDPAVLTSALAEPAKCEGQAYLPADPPVRQAGRREPGLQCRRSPVER